MADRSLEPGRVRLARMRRGLSQAELARRLDVTGRTIQTYESLGAPRSATARLAAALDFPEGYFLRPFEGDTLHAVGNFRAGRATTKRQRSAAIAASAMGFEVGQWIADRFLLPSVDVPNLEDEDPRQAAAILRGLWGLGTGPLPNLVQLSESRGIRVAGLPGVAASVDAFSRWHGNIPHVFVARAKTPERSRFDVAHEIGHLVMHRYHGAQAADGAPSAAAEEREADAFASEFLVPREAIFEYLRPNPPVDDLLQAARAFVVSAMALAYAAHKAGRMSDWSYRTTCIELSRRGFRSGEPSGMPAHERSRVYPHVLASRGQGQGRITGKRIAAELDLPAADVRAIMLDSEMAAVPRAPAEAVDTGRSAPGIAAGTEAGTPSASTSQRSKRPAKGAARPHLHSV
ncbi:MAG: XRE family transcriptional regulator [Actinomycetaceae bacterium]|nr:XRE family transcriptional regulator [Actinomycetaceae bacterium]